MCALRDECIRPVCHHSILHEAHTPFLYHIRETPCHDRASQFGAAQGVLSVLTHLVAAQTRLGVIGDQETHDALDGMWKSTLMIDDKKKRVNASAWSARRLAAQHACAQSSARGQVQPQLEKLLTLEKCLIVQVVDFLPPLTAGLPWWDCKIVHTRFSVHLNGLLTHMCSLVHPSIQTSSSRCISRDWCQQW